MNFELTDEQQAIVDTTRTFTEKELIPHEERVEKLGDVPPDLVKQIKERSIAAGIYACNMPAEYGGGGLDSFDSTLVDREFGATSYALHYIVARPSNILRACKDEQIQEYLIPTITGERVDCLAMSEPDAGSDVRGMKCTAVKMARTGSSTEQNTSFRMPTLPTTPSCLQQPPRNRRQRDQRKRSPAFSSTSTHLVARRLLDTTAFQTLVTTT